MTKFSILMTTHNSEEFVNEAVMSVLNQTILDFELLIIDDASSDNTRQQLEEYTNHELVNVTYLDSNIGVSAARNKALSMARGRYILFMDADDLLEPMLLERLSGVIDKQRPDLIIFDFFRFTDAKTEVVNADVSYTKMYTAVWNKAYKASSIRNLRFPVDIRLGEDTLFTVLAFKNAKHIVHLPSIGYRYRQRQGSLSHERLASPHLQAIIAVYRILEAFRSNLPDELKILLNQQLLVHTMFFVRDAQPTELMAVRQRLLRVQNLVQPGLKHYDNGVARGIKNNLFWWLFGKSQLNWLLTKYVDFIL